MDIAHYIDHTFLKPTATLEDIRKTCDEAVRYGFKAVCIPPPFVKEAKKATAGTQVRVATVIGFPFGYSAIEAKMAEILLAIVDGADELDMVINIIALKNNDWQYLANEINSLLPIIHNNGKLVKVIIESGVLTDEEICRCCTLYVAAGVDFLKTSTGYAEKSATVEAVQLMRKQLPGAVQIKASGGIRTFEFAKQLIEAGATRLGCSASIAVLQGADAENNTGY